MQETHQDVIDWRRKRTKSYSETRRPILLCRARAVEIQLQHSASPLVTVLQIRRRRARHPASGETLTLPLRHPFPTPTICTWTPAFLFLTPAILFIAPLHDKLAHSLSRPSLLSHSLPPTANTTATMSGTAKKRIMKVCMSSIIKISVCCSPRGVKLAEASYEPTAPRQRTALLVEELRGRHGATPNG